MLLSCSPLLSVTGYSVSLMPGYCLPRPSLGCTMQDEGAAVAALPSVAGAAAAAFALPGGHAFATPLAAALDLLGDPQHPEPDRTGSAHGAWGSSMAPTIPAGRSGAQMLAAREAPLLGPETLAPEGGPRAAAARALWQALDMIAAAPGLAALAAPGGGDAAPDLAQAAAVLITAAVRGATCGAAALPAPRLALAGFSVGAACAAACHPEVSASALACLEALLGAGSTKVCTACAAEASQKIMCILHPETRKLLAVILASVGRMFDDMSGAAVSEIGALSPRY